MLLIFLDSLHITEIKITIDTRRGLLITTILSSLHAWTWLEEPAFYHVKMLIRICPWSRARPFMTSSVSWPLENEPLIMDSRNSIFMNLNQAVSNKERLNFVRSLFVHYFQWNLRNASISVLSDTGKSPVNLAAVEVNLKYELLQFRVRSVDSFNII